MYQEQALNNHHGSLKKINLQTIPGLDSLPLHLDEGQGTVGRQQSVGGVKVNATRIALHRHFIGTC